MSSVGAFLEIRTRSTITNTVAGITATASRAEAAGPNRGERATEAIPNLNERAPNRISASISSADAAIGRETAATT